MCNSSISSIKFFGLIEIVAVFRDNQLSPMMFPTVINKIGTPYNQAYVLTEINDIGQQVVYILNNEIEYDDYKIVCEKIVEDNIQRLEDLFTELQDDLNLNFKCRLKKVIKENNNGSLNNKYMEDIKYHILNISKRNKKEINEYLDKFENELIISN